MGNTKIEWAPMRYRARHALIAAINERLTFED